MYEVKRYSPVVVDDGYEGYGQMEQDDHGDWVSLEAYEEIAFMLQTALSTIKSINSTLEAANANLDNLDPLGVLRSYSDEV